MASRVAIAPAANALFDLTGAIFVDDASLPATVSSLSAGDYRPYRIVDGNTFTVSAVAASFFTMGATGPYFRPGSGNLPGPVTRIRTVFQIERPTSVSGTAGATIFGVGASNFRITVSGFGAGTFDLAAANITIGGTNRTITWSGGTNPLTGQANDVSNTHEIDVDATALTISYSRNGSVINTGTLSGVSGNFDNSIPTMCGRSAGTNLLPQGFRVTSIAVYVNGSGSIAQVGGKNVAISGNAATVNADTWKLGGDAT